MTFARAVFIFAFLMLIVGAVGARFIIGPLLFGNAGTPSYSVAARVSTPTAPPATRTPSPSPTPTQHILPTPTRVPIAVPTVRSTATSTSQPRATQTAPSTKVNHATAHSRATVRPTVHAAG